MDIVEMPQEDYSADREVEQFAEKYRASGIGLAMEDLSYTYHTGTEVFSKASLEAWPHEIIALVGPSGEGKTTMLRLILSLLRARGEKHGLVQGKTENNGLHCRRPQGNCFLMCHRGIRCFQEQLQKICEM